MRPDQIILNANIYTMHADQPRASALAIKNERIVAVGENDMIRALASPDTTITDAGGYCIVPGFVDAHVHWKSYAQSLQSVNLWEVPSKAEALERLAARAAQLAPGEWIVGRGWQQDIWADKQFPTQQDLNAIISEHPVYLPAKSGHAAWVNSLALRMAGIDENTPDPAGGSIQRDADSRPTGILFENPAMRLVADIIPDLTHHELTSYMRHAQETVLRLGLTGFHDFDDPLCMVGLQMLREDGDLHLRVIKQINQDWLEHALALGIRSGFGDTWIRFGGLKLFADGALGARTALMIEAYENEPDNYGIAVLDKEEMQELVCQATANGLLSTIHAIGDRAVHDVLDVFEVARRVEAEEGIARDKRRHRIEHVQLIHPSDVSRLAELDLIASMQPIHATGDYEIADAYWGTRAAYSYAWQKQLKAGARLIFGSDAPIEPISPLKGIHAAITRRRADGSPGSDGWFPEERVNIQEAVHAYTTGPAYAAGTEHETGQLRENYLADLVVIDQNIFEIEPMAILECNVVGTMVGGQWRYREFD